VAQRSSTCRKHRQRWLDHRVSGKHRGEVKLRGGSGSGGGGKRKNRLIEHHMARNEDSTRGKVIASVPLVIRGVHKEDIESRTWSQLVRSRGGGVRVTRTPKDSKVIVARRGTEESVVWYGSWAGSESNAVNEVGGGVQALSPEASRKRGLK